MTPHFPTRRSSELGDEAAAVDAAADLLALERVGKEAEVDVDQVGGAAIDGDVIARLLRPRCRDLGFEIAGDEGGAGADLRSEEHTSELQSLMRISYAVFCLK